MMKQLTGLLAVGGVFLHRRLEIPQRLGPHVLLVLVVVPAVGFCQPGLELGQVVREGVASVGHEAGH